MCSTRGYAVSNSKYSIILKYSWDICKASLKMRDFASVSKTSTQNTMFIDDFYAKFMIFVIYIMYIFYVATPTPKVYRVYMVYGISKVLCGRTINFFFVSV